MQNFNFTQHLTIKNIFIAIVAVNILSAMSTTRLGGTFHETAKPSVRTVAQAAKVPATAPALIAHMVPGEALPAKAEVPAVRPRPVWQKPVQARPQPQRVTSSSPPSVNWIMLLSIGAMALYVRYLMSRAVQHAAGQVVNVAKQVASAVKAGASNTSAKPPMPRQTSQQSTQQPPTKTPVQQKAPQPRKSTVVRPSRWPFAA